MGNEFQAIMQALMAQQMQPQTIEVDEMGMNQQGSQGQQVNLSQIQDVLMDMNNGAPQFRPMPMDVTDKQKKSGDYVPDYGGW